MLTHCPIHQRPSVGFCEECREDYEQRAMEQARSRQQPPHAVRDFALTFLAAIACYILAALWMAM